MSDFEAFRSELLTLGEWVAANYQRPFQVAGRPIKASEMGALLVYAADIAATFESLERGEGLDLGEFFRRIRDEGGGQGRGGLSVNSPPRLGRS